MTTTKSVILKIVALILAVLLGFGMCVGSIVGAGYFVYSKLSYETLAKLGLVPQDTTAILDPEAEVSLTGMTIQGLIKEIGELSALGEAVTINMLKERYGLKLTEEQMLMIPEGLHDVPLAKLFAEGGIDVLFESIQLNYILQFIPEGVLAAPARTQLADKTVKDVIAADLGYLLNGVHLGHLLGVTYGKNAEGVYIPVYADPANPTLFELLAPIDLGDLLGVMTKGGDVLSVFHQHIGEVMLSQLFASAIEVGGALANLLEGKAVSDIIKQGEDGVFVLDAWSILNGERMGTVLGFEPIYAGEEPSLSTEEPEVPEELILIGWRDADGNEVYGLNRGLAFATLDGLQEGFNMDDMLAEVYFGDLLEYKPVYDNDTGEILSWTKQDGTPVDAMYEGMAPKKLQEAFGGEDGQGGLAMDTLFDGVFLGDVLGYTPDYDGETEGIQSTRPELPEIPEPFAWYNGADDTAAKVTGLDATLANIPLGKLMDSESDYQVSDAFEDSTVGDLMGYSKGDDGVWYEYRGEAETAPEFDPINLEANDGYEAVTGIDKAIANISIGKMLNSEEEYKIEEEFIGVSLGELLDYKQDKDGKWYKYTGADEVAPEFDPEHPEDLEDYSLVTGANATFADYDLGKIMTGEQEIDTDDMYIHEVLALTSKPYTAYYLNELGEKVEMKDANDEPVVLTVWFGKDGKKVDAVIGAIAPLKVGKVSTALGETKIGQVIGFYSVERSTGDGAMDTETVWYSGEIESIEIDGEPTEIIVLSDAEGIMLAMADLTVNDMSENDKVTGAIQKVEIGEAMGYVKSGDVWCEKDDEGNLIPLTGVMAKIAGKTIGELDNSVIDEMYIHEIMGYTEENGVYKDAQGNEITGIMAAIAGYTVGGLDGEGGLDSLQIGKVIGWKWIDNEETAEDTTDGYWYDPKTDQSAVGIMTHFADLTVNDLSENDKMTEAIKKVSIAEAMGYEKNDDDEWCSNSEGNLVPVSGLMSAIADMTVGELDDENGGINGIYVGDAMDYVKNEDGVWCEKNADGTLTPAAGMMSAFAGLTIGDLKDPDAVTGAIKKVKVGEAMGYEKIGDTWYEEDGQTELTGIMKAIAGSYIEDLSDDLDKTLIGDILGYTKIRVCPICDLSQHLGCTNCLYMKSVLCDDCKEENDPDCMECTYVKKVLCDEHASTEACTDDECAFWWYDLSRNDIANRKTTPLVNKMSSSTIGTIGKVMDDLRVGDIFTDEDLHEDGGFLQLIEPTTKVSELGHAVNHTFETTTMAKYRELGIIHVSPEAARNLTYVDPEWEDQTIQEFLDFLISKFPQAPDTTETE